MQPGGTAPIEMLAHPREQEEVDGLMHEMLLGALYDQQVLPAIEDRQGPAEVVDHRPVAMLVDDVPGGDERRDRVAESGEVGLSTLDPDLDLAIARAGCLEPGEVTADRVPHLGPVALDRDPEAADVEVHGRGLRG